MVWQVAASAMEEVVTESFREARTVGVAHVGAPVAASAAVGH